MQIVGYKFTSFNAKDTGNLISGVKLYLAEKRDDVTGMITDSIFLTDAKLGSFKPELKQEVVVYYNKFGKPEGIRAV